MENQEGYIYVEIVFADALVPVGTRASANTVLTQIFSRHWIIC